VKLVKHFNEFLKNEVNLNQSRIDILENRVATITNFISGNTFFKKYFIRAIPQGSYSHRTIIKPTKKKAIFDADVVVYLKPIKGWEAQDYIQQMYELFRSSSLYKTKVSRQTRCVKLNYAGEFHIDIVLCIRDKSFWDGEQEYVCNRLVNELESCSSVEYSDWVKEQNRVIGYDHLIKAIRLSKYLRDHKQTFSVKSILLTTIIASRVGFFDKFIGNNDFKDLPTTFKNLFNRMNDWLEGYDTMPVVYNPVDDAEDFNRHWDENKFQNFKNQICKYNDWINDAYDEKDKATSIVKWQKIFGMKFGSASLAKMRSSSTVSGYCGVH
jgi:hypothetical protein